MSEAGNRNRKMLRDIRREAGLCIMCGRPARENRVTCEICGQYNNESAKRSYRKRILESGRELQGRGRKPIYEYTAWCGRKIVAQGSAADLARVFHITHNQVCNYARTGQRRHEGVQEPVVIERRRLLHE